MSVSSGETGEAESVDESGGLGRSEGEVKFVPAVAESGESGLGFGESDWDDGTVGRTAGGGAVDFGTAEGDPAKEPSGW